ncbi:MAG TPA: OmpH family outer membrane protein [Balneolales bacterium]|nr:OmpH family outer membrane protein [Balneolales bacterium]
MYRKTLFLFGILLIIGPGLVQAQQLRIGFMNPQEVLDSLPATAAVQKKLNDYLQQKQIDYQQKVKDYQKQITDYQNKKATLSQAEDQKEQAHLGQLSQQLQQYQQSAQSELQQKRQQLLGPILDDIQSAIKEVAQDMKLDFVVNKETQDGSQILMYTSESSKKNLDITQKVIDKLTQ